MIRKLVLQEQEPSCSIDCLGLIGQHPRSDMVDASQPLVRYFLHSKPFAAMFTSLSEDEHVVVFAGLTRSEKEKTGGQKKSTDHRGTFLIERV